MAGNEEISKFDHKAFLEKVSTRPGVYDMRDQQGKTLYIGKAKKPEKPPIQLLQSNWSDDQNHGPGQ